MAQEETTTIRLTENQLSILDEAMRLLKNKLMEIPFCCQDKDVANIRQLLIQTRKDAGWLED